MCHLCQNCRRPDINFFKDHEFADFRASLDAEMKRLQSAGVGSVYVSRLNHFTLKKKICCGRKTLRRPQPGGSFEHNGVHELMDSILHCSVEVSTDYFAIILARLTL